MRDSFVTALLEIAKKDPETMLLVGDLGFKIFDRFRQEVPLQFLNVGIAEQNLIGLSAGMALEGKQVFAYSIGNFPTLRALEQIRNDLCYHNASVTIVSAGTGLSYGALGASHHATEDIACLRGLPNLTVLSPGDPIESRWATITAYELKRPVYLRLGRAGEPEVYKDWPRFDLGHMCHVHGKGRVALVSTGGILNEVVKASRLLNEKGIAVSVYSMHTLKPLDRKGVEELAAKVDLMVSIEEHSIIGGLGGALAEVLAEMVGKPCRFFRIGIPDRFVCEVGGQKYLRRLYGLNHQSIARSVEMALNEAV